MRVLIIDLNNFSRYPTLPVGQLVAVMRNQEVEVDVLSPLARGVHGYPRLTRARPWGLLDDRLRYWSAVTPSRIVRYLRRAASALVRPGGSNDRETILKYTQEMLGSHPDVVLISAYTMYHDTSAAIAALCKARGIPVVVGGNYFIAPEIVERWLTIEGITAVYGGEPERELVAILRDLVSSADISRYAGVFLPAKRVSKPAPPLDQLDELPFADYTDFPWGLYPNRIIPIMTGRGCGWGKCRFCADVITSAGRTFRSRTLQNVLDELRFQHDRHAAELFVFLDLKLNSNLELWRGLLVHLPALVPKAAWTASVHIDTRPDHGLFRDDLIKARKAGLVRVTTGLESASPALLKRMAKGTDLARTATFIRDASEAGISVRLTTIIGYPGEQPGDVDATTKFLKEHESCIERVTLNRFALMLGTSLDQRIESRSRKFPSIIRGLLDQSTAVVGHDNLVSSTRAHRRAVGRLLAIVHRINRKPLTDRAQEFEGVM